MYEILEKFCLDGRAVSCAPYGNGHINRTYLVMTDRKHPYILQKINHVVFQDVPALMHNISSVTSYLRARGLDARHALTLVPTRQGETYLFLEDEDAQRFGYYRVYEFITDSLCMDRPETAQDFRQSAVAFGNFQMLLKDFPADTLAHTIPRFHDTVDRYRIFRRAVQEDKMGRAAGAAREIEFALAQEECAGVMLDMLRNGELPLRVTHNDTKLNNVMLDAATHEPLCVIDLDTVMPGLSGNDFGDSIRFGASSAAEDERDLDKVEMRLDLFQAYADGFLTACGDALTPAEIETLPMAAKLMTLECGVRVLTDYLEGDVYFRIHRPAHNLERTRTQFKLVADMEQKWGAMQAIVRREAARARGSHDK